MDVFALSVGLYSMKITRGARGLDTHGRLMRVQFV